MATKPEGEDRKDGRKKRDHAYDGEQVPVHKAFAHIARDFGRMDILLNAAAQPPGASRAA